MSTREQDFEGGFESRLLAELTEVDRVRPAAGKAPAHGSKKVRPSRTFRLRWQGAAVGLVGALVVAGAVVASGVLSPSYFEASRMVIPGEQVGMKGSGCAAGTTVTITMDGREFGTATSNQWGAFDFQRDLPAGISMGKHALQATCTGGNGASVVQNTDFAVVTARPTSPPAIDVSGHMTPGGEVWVKGGPAKANTTISILLDGQPFGTAVSDSNGSFAVALTLSSTVAAGSHDVQVVATAPGRRRLRRALRDPGRRPLTRRRFMAAAGARVIPRLRPLHRAGPSGDGARPQLRKAICHFSLTVRYLQTR